MLDLRCGDCLEMLKELPGNSVDSLVTDPPAGISFMGKSWDGDRGGRDQWVNWLSGVMSEAYRVLKPGAHGLVWAIPRTAHWTATALEDAGFEVRDCISHLFGTGFPKSLDVSKAIDKAAGAEREVVGVDKTRLRPNRKYKSSAIGNIGGKDTDAPCDRTDNGATITAPATEAAKQWAGFGTALKPAAEFWWLVRKPLSEKTVATNVEKWGCGGLNIGGCRIAGPIPVVPQDFRSAKGQTSQGLDATRRNGEKSRSEGRFPANVVFSHSVLCTDEACDADCAVGLLDGQSGIKPSNVRKNKKGVLSEGITGWAGTNANPPDDSGGASRFFYCAKVSPSERGESKHPTMKSLKLMAYLCRLVTPPGGVVLDPFMGSGSTGVAAVAEGFGFVGVEREKEYFDFAKGRIEKIAR